MEPSEVKQNQDQGQDIKVEDKSEPKSEPEPKEIRTIVIETDGNMAKIVKAEVAGNLELKAILVGLANSIK